NYVQGNANKGDLALASDRSEQGLVMGGNRISILLHSRADVLNKRNRTIMLKKVQVDWIQGLLENSLHGALLLQLGMEYRPEMVERPWDMILERLHQDSR